MKKSFLWMSCILLILLLGNCRQHECPNTIQNIVLRDAAIKDAFINSTFPSQLRGSDERLQSAAWTFSGNFGVVRSFMNFDLSSIPQGSTITKAELTLYADTTNFTSVSNPTVIGHSSLTGSNEWKIKRITSDWSESNLTWNNKPTYDNTTAISMDSSVSNSETYVVDIASFVQDQLDHPGLYYGIMFQLNTEVQYRIIAFCSKDHRYASTLGPTLNITYIKK